MIKRPAAVSDRNRLKYGDICGKIAVIFVLEIPQYVRKAGEIPAETADIRQRYAPKWAKLR